VALAAALARPWADVVLSGAANAAQLDANLQAFRVALRPDELARLDALVEPPVAYWHTRAGLSWS
jgi:aryl-alcohol dehydrogenase-like predicted oxidoreductase